MAEHRHRETAGGWIFARFQDIKWNSPRTWATARGRGLIWSVYVTTWTFALLFPVALDARPEDVDAPSSPLRYGVAKTVHVTAYAVMTLLSGWLNVPLRFRWLLVFFLMAHGTATEMGQWTMRELHWSGALGELPDVAYDNAGVLIGLILGWKWWTRGK